MNTTFYRELGRSGIQVTALGMGCWAIGGPFWTGETPVGWGKVDDEESIRAVHRALELGVNFFDTADVYGAGHVSGCWPVHWQAAVRKLSSPPNLATGSMKIPNKSRGAVRPRTISAKRVKRRYGV